MIQIWKLLWSLHCTLLVLLGRKKKDSKWFKHQFMSSCIFLLPIYSEELELVAIVLRNRILRRWAHSFSAASGIERPVSWVGTSKTKKRSKRSRSPSITYITWAWCLAQCQSPFLPDEWRVGLRGLVPRPMSSPFQPGESRVGLLELTPLLPPFRVDLTKSRKRTIRQRVQFLF